VACSEITVEILFKRFKILSPSGKKTRMQNLAATPCGSDLSSDSSSGLCSKPERANHHVPRRRLWANSPRLKLINRIQRWLQAMRLWIPLTKRKHRRRGSPIRSLRPAWEWHVWNDGKNKMANCKNKLPSRSSFSCNYEEKTCCKTQRLII
jgi:hypothetical protein